MKSTQNVVIKKGRHSRGMLSGIFRVLSLYVNQAKCLFVNNLYVEDPRQRHSGMTPNFKEEALNKGAFRAPLRSGFTLRPSSSRSVSMRDIGAAPRSFTARSVTPQCRYAGYSGRTGFTLIELLVVVLIIGILAAVAVPQYQMAVWKSRFATVKALTKNLAEAEEIYYLSNGNYTTDVNELDVDVPQPDRSSVSSQYGNYYYPWGYCQIEVITGTVQKVACRLKKDASEFLGYTQYLNHSQRAPSQKACVAYHKSGETDTFQHRLCKNETGKQERITGTNNTNSSFLY